MRSKPPSSRDGRTTSGWHPSSRLAGRNDGKPVALEEVHYGSPDQVSAGAADSSRAPIESDPPDAADPDASAIARALLAANARSPAARGPAHGESDRPIDRRAPQGRREIADTRVTDNTLPMPTLDVAHLPAREALRVIAMQCEVIFLALVEIQATCNDLLEEQDAIAASFPLGALDAYRIACFGESES